MAPVIQVRVLAKKACFTMPAMRSMRFSEPFMTPSAAKGVLRSLYWKPEFEWVVRRILILRPIEYRYFAVKEQFASGHGGTEGRITGNQLLHDVEYIIEASPIPNPHRDPNPKKIMGETVRRLRKGQSWRTPFLGQSEYMADWEFVEKGTVHTPAPINMTAQGLLWDLVPVNIRKDLFTPVFHTAEVKDGIYTVPPSLWEEHRDQFFKARHAAHPHRKR